MKISGCYIVKNEENNLERSILSIRNICDELLVVDTGSTDGTVALAQSLGARVLHFDWVNDFSKARNFALENATGDYIIFLDADEWFDKSLGPGEKDAIEAKFRNGAIVFTAPYRDLLGGIFLPPVRMVRMFCNLPNVRYENSIHEVLSGSFKQTHLDDRFTIMHIGYEAELQTIKVKRNLEILRSTLETEKNPSKRMIYYFYMARESSLLKNLDEAFEYAEEFFKLWNSMQNKRHMSNIAIAAYYVMCSFSLVQTFQVVPDEQCERYIKAFTEEFPTHPVSWMCMADYHYLRTGDFIKVERALQRMDEMQAIYTVDTFINDNTPLERYMSNVLTLKGNSAYAFGDKLKALECLSGVLKATNLEHDVVRKILTLIKDQPAGDILAFIGSFKPEPSAGNVEIYLSELRYFPGLKDVYMYYAMQHIKLSRQHSDITAIASLFGDSSYDHVLKVAEMTMSTDIISADTLILATAFRSNDEEIRRRIPENSRIDRLILSYFEETPVNDITIHELNVFSRAAQILMFIDIDDITRKMYSVMDNYKYERFLIKYNYYVKGSQFDRIFASLDFDLDSADTTTAANVYYALGNANFENRAFDDAFKYYKLAVEYMGGNHELFREIRILSSVAPRFSDEAKKLISLYEGIMPKSQADDRADAIKSAFSHEKPDVRA